MEDLPVEKPQKWAGTFIFVQQVYTHQSGHSRNSSVLQASQGKVSNLPPTNLLVIVLQRLVLAL